MRAALYGTMTDRFLAIPPRERSGAPKGWDPKAASSYYLPLPSLGFKSEEGPSWDKTSWSRLCGGPSNFGLRIVNLRLENGVHNPQPEIRNQMTSVKASSSMSW